MISKDTIDKVMTEADIVTVVSDFVKLKKQGTSLIANCPFHGEKTGSFHVSAAKGVYKCFGCGKGGNNPISFVMQHEEYSYPEAVRWLAKRFNIEVEEDGVSDEQKQALQSKENFYLVNDFAKKRFIENAANSEVALQYFEERGINEESRSKFEIGFAKPDHAALYEDAIKNHFNQETIVKAGLAKKGRDIMDTFRDRIIFPIHNITGRIVGFGGRIVIKGKTELAKFINTHENEVYQKRDVVYGLFQAKKAIAKSNKCMVVEGYNDVVLLHQNEMENTVASSGTALTKGHIKLIRRFTDKLTLLFDGDAAGLKAATEGIENAIEDGFHVRVVLFPDGEDPDSMVRKLGAKEMKAYIKENELDIIDFYFKGADKLSTEELNERGEIILRLIAKIPLDRIFSINGYINKLALLFKASVPKIIERVNKVRGSIEFASEPMTDIAERVANNYELEFMKVLLTYGNQKIFIADINSGTEDQYCFMYMMERCGKPENFRDPLARRLFEVYYDQLTEGNIPDMDFFLKHSDDQISGFATNINIVQHNYSPAWNVEANTKDSDKFLIVRNTLSYFLIYKFRELVQECQEVIRSSEDQELVKEKMKADLNFKKQIAKECSALGINFILT